MDNRFDEIRRDDAQETLIEERRVAHEIEVSTYWPADESLTRGNDIIDAILNVLASK